MGLVGCGSALILLVGLGSLVFYYLKYANCSKCNTFLGFKAKSNKCQSCNVTRDQTNMDNTKKQIATISALGLLIGGVLYFNVNRTPEDLFVGTEASVTRALSTPKETKSNNEVNSLPVDKIEPNINQSSKLGAIDGKFSEKQKSYSNEIIQWKREHFGYFLTNVKESDYNSYSVDTLETMAEQQNLKALDMLASKYLEAGNIEMSNGANHRAAILGSTWALRNLGNALVPYSTSEEGTHARVMNQLSYMQVALIRGDKEFVKDIALTLDAHKDNLTDEDIKTIKTNGRNIYNQLEAERIKLGLVAFDNSVPWFVDAHYTKN